MTSRYRRIYLLTWNYLQHSIRMLSAFPDSHRFYSGGYQLPKGLNSLFYVATCNRVEIYLETASDEDGLLVPGNWKNILNHLPLHEGFIHCEPVVKQGTAAIRHLFEVTSGLKSMAVGETQITGQIRRDFQRAMKNRYISPFMVSVIQKAIDVQKKIRSETKLGQNPISLLNLLEQAVEKRSGEKINCTRILVGGTGDMSRKTLRHFLKKHPEQVTIVRKSLQSELPSGFKALQHEFTDFKPEFITWETLKNSEASQYTLFISSSASEEYLLSETELEMLYENKVLAENCFIADLGVPANLPVLKSGHRKLFINLETLLEQSEANKNLRMSYLDEAYPYIERGISSLWLDLIYRDNPDILTDTLHSTEKERTEDFENLFSGPLKNLSQKQKRILHDYLIKQNRKILRAHKHLFLEMLTRGGHELY